MNISNEINYLSLRMKLDDIVTDRNFEIKVLENIRYCNKIIGKRFRIIFWNDNLTEKECKNFVKRNEKLLFEVNTKITKEFNYVWFLVKSDNDKSNCRYHTDNNMLGGISMYLKLAKFLIKRDRDL